jgi:hypothetical protein
MTRRFQWCVVVAVLFALACRQPESPADIVSGQLRQDGSFPVVEFARLPGPNGPLRLKSAPRIVIGGLQKDDSLELSPGTSYLPVVETVDGLIVVGNQNRIFWYDRSGQLLRIRGRSGTGPGEFLDIKDLCPQNNGDLAVIDRTGRWSVWNAQGQLLAEHGRQGIVPYRGCSRSGDILVQNDVESSVDSVGNRTAQYHLSVLSGEHRLELGQQIAPTYFIGILFEPSFSFRDSVLLMADPRSFELRELSIRDGSVRRSIRILGGNRQLTQSAFESIVVSTIPRGESEQGRARRMERARQIGNPGQLPAFSMVRHDREGRIWINPAFDRQHWYVIDQGGMRLSAISLPGKQPSAQLQGFSKSHAIIRTIDEDGAIQLSFHEIVERQ